MRFRAESALRRIGVKSLVCVILLPALSGDDHRRGAGCRLAYAQFMQNGAGDAGNRRNGSL